MNEFRFLEFLGPLIFLYAETHYAFKGIYSRLKRKVPEIVADVPHRIDSGAAIPVLILIKDSDKYPVKLDSVQVELGFENQKERHDFEFGASIREPFWHRVLEVPLRHDLSGRCMVDVTLHFSQNGETYSVRNDNYVSTSHAPFEVFISGDKLPGSDGWYFGDFHCHTNYTCDQVEFGAPLKAAATLAQAMGLSFYCATDHSYDLDDEPDDYLKKDPRLTKWKDLLEQVKSINRSNGEFVIVPGEEVSAGNTKRRNVHFLILNHPEFLPGDGDSAEKWFRTKPNLSIEQILGQINSEAVAFAAHPSMKPPLLQRLLVRRGNWDVKDCQHPELHGLQIWNGTDADLEAGKKIWTQLLLEGQRKFIAAGNDAHGNFNRFRQIGIPFFTMRENHDHLFGKVRTGIWSENGFSLGACLKAFKEGKMVVTNGPFVQITVTADSGHVARLGEEIFGQQFRLECDCRSTSEFGGLEALKIYFGDLTSKKERLISDIDNFEKLYSHGGVIELAEITTSGYVRAELYSKASARSLVCLTNPIWINYRSLDVA